MTEPSVPSHYDVLDLPSTATPEEIEQSYRALISHCHPDAFNWKDERLMHWAEIRFKALDHAYDVLTDPHRRHNYDRVRSGNSIQAPMYSYGYGYVHDADSILPQSDGAHGTDYERTWHEFASKPLEWTEKGKPPFSPWVLIHGLTIIIIVGLVLLFFGGSSSVEIYQFLATTRSTPMIESHIPMHAAAVGAGLAFVIALVSTVYAGVKHPYSVRHSKAFRRYLLARAGDMWLSLTYVCVFFGAIVGHYLF